MGDYIDNLVDRKGRVYHEYQSIVTGAGAENRDLTPDEMQTLTRMDEELRQIDAEQKRHERLVAEVNLADTVRAAVAPRVETSVKQTAPTDAEILRAIALGETDFGIFGMSAAAKRAFGGPFERRALGDTYTGGSAVAEKFADTLVAYERTLNPILSVATVLETPDDGALRIPRLTADPAYGGTVTAEGAGIVAADPTLSSVILYTYKYPSITFVSSELVRANAINLESIIAQSAARELGLDFGQHLTDGTGTDQPNGAVTAAANGGTATNAAPGTGVYFGGGDLIDLFFGVAAPYRPMGTWMFNASGLAAVRKLIDGNGAPIFNPDFSGVSGAPAGTIMGRPVLENPAMTSPGSAVAKAIVFGDFSRYWVRRLPIRVDVDKSFKFQNDQLSIRTILEGDGDLIDTAAIKYLVCKAV